MMEKWFKDDWKDLPPRGQRWIFIWAMGVIMLFLTVGSVLVIDVHNDKQTAIARQARRMDANLPDDPKQSRIEALSPAANPLRVMAGIYVDRVVELSVKDTSWTVDFYLWFRWQGEDIADLDKFDVVDGAIDTDSTHQEVATIDRQTGEHYVRYRVLAKITKFFDIARFPCDDHYLTVAIEHQGKPRDQLLFVADAIDSSVSSRVKVPGYTIYAPKLIEKAHAYKTARGDPSLNAGAKATHSQLRYGIGIKRESWSFYVKMFQGLYVAIAVAMLALFIKPDHVDPRFGLGVGGLFAAVANSYMTAQLIPDTGVFALADTINGLGIGMILLTLIQSAVSLHLFSSLGEAALSRWLDRVSFVVFLIGYVGINLLLPQVAAL